MRIALFGGSFDPPHNGHLTIANTLIDKKYCDDAWFIPCAQHPHQKNLSPAKHRLSMLEKLNGHPICAHELNKSTMSYSIETLEFLQKLFPTDTFFWVIGSDQLINFDKWHRYQDILNNFKVLVYPRENFPMSPLLTGMEEMKNVATINTSSTKIKKLLQDKKPIDSHTTTEIIEYIENNNLY